MSKFIQKLLVCINTPLLIDQIACILAVQALTLADKIYFWNADITETNPEIIIKKSIINYAYRTFAKWTKS